MSSFVNPKFKQGYGAKKIINKVLNKERKKILYIIQSFLLFLYELYFCVCNGYIYQSNFKILENIYMSLLSKITLVCI